VAWPPQLCALHDALLNAGATAHKAGRAAQELAGYETRIASIDSRLSVLTWMVGFNLVLTAGLLWRLLAR
jgi:hypothetical protein